MATHWSEVKKMLKEQLPPAMMDGNLPRHLGLRNLFMYDGHPRRNSFSLYSEGEATLRAHVWALDPEINMIFHAVAQTLDELEKKDVKIEWDHMSLSASNDGSYLYPRADVEPFIDDASVGLASIQKPLSQTFNHLLGNKAAITDKTYDDLCIAIAVESMGLVDIMYPRLDR